MQLLEGISKETSFKAIKIEAGTIKGVNIPCLLCIPKQAEGKQKLMMIFNNENGKTLDESMANMENGLIGAINQFEFNSPIIVPILPSQTEFNQELQSNGIDLQVGEPKQFARECFLPEIPEQSRFYRLDQQVNVLLQNVISNSELREQIQSTMGIEKRIKFDEKVIGFGHSGAGASMLRYCLLHPEMLDKIIIGGNGDIVPTPIGENGDKLTYPFGIADYKELFGEDFDIEAFKKVGFQFYIGDREDEVPRFDTIRDENYREGGTGINFAPEDSATLYKQIYGTEFFVRFQKALEEYEKAGLNIGLKIYEDDCHTPIQSTDLKRIISGEKEFDGEPSKQISKVLHKRRIISKSEEDVLDSAIEATEETTKTSTINQQAQTIRSVQKERTQQQSIGTNGIDR